MNRIIPVRIKNMRSALVLLFVASISLSGCTVIAVADAAASATVGAAKATVKTTGAVLDAAIPDGEED